MMQANNLPNNDVGTMSPYCKKANCITKMHFKMHHTNDGTIEIPELDDNFLGGIQKI